MQHDHVVASQKLAPESQLGFVIRDIVESVQFKDYSIMQWVWTAVHHSSIL